MLIFSSRYFVWRAFSLACRAVSWEGKEERRESERGGVEGEGIRWGKRGKRGKRGREEEEEIEEKQRGRKRKGDRFDCNFRCIA